jgi:hypothetical protein
MLSALEKGESLFVVNPSWQEEKALVLGAAAFFGAREKTVVYASPFKALAHQKYALFRAEHPTGLHTGDFCVDMHHPLVCVIAELIVRTAATAASSLGCVILDKIHCFADVSRGAVWEQALMLLPPDVPVVLLSAPLQNETVWLDWLEMRRHKIQRFYPAPVPPVVSLLYYVYGYNGSTLLLPSTRPLQKATYDTLVNNSRNGTSVTRRRKINTMIKTLVKHSMLPAVLYIPSRTIVEATVDDIRVPLLETAPPAASLLDALWAEKGIDVASWVDLPEYSRLATALTRGVAYYHSGMVPLLREAVETLVMRGCVRLLVSTEASAAVANHHFATAVFSSLSKFDGVEWRLLSSYEYLQMTQSVPTVVHCTPLFKLPSFADYRTLVDTTAVTLSSSFDVSSELVLSLCPRTVDAMADYIKGSFQCASHKTEWIKWEQKERVLYDQLHHLPTPMDALAKYHKLNKTAAGASHKFAVRRELDEWKEQYYFGERDYQIYCRWLDVKEKVDSTRQWGVASLKQAVATLEAEQIVRTTETGVIECILPAVCTETHPTILFTHPWPVDMGWAEWASVLSCLASTSDDGGHLYPDVVVARETIKVLLNNLSTSSIRRSPTTLWAAFVVDWGRAETAAECVLVLTTISANGLFVGDFVKMLWKITAIATEWRPWVPEAATSALDALPDRLLKHIAQRKSLYVNTAAASRIITNQDNIE